MNPFRFLWRLVRLLSHTLAGISLSWRHGRSGTGAMPPAGPVMAWNRRLLEILHVRLHCRGAPPEGAALVVANHVSWLDVPVLGACAPVAFLSKESIAHWPLIGWFARAAGTLFIRRGRGEAAQVARLLAERLAEGRQVALFPEGRIGDGHEVGRFFPRLFAAAIDSGAPVIPVALRYRYRGRPDDAVVYRSGRTFMGILFRILARPESEVEAVFCPPIPSKEKDRRTLAREAEAAIQAVLAAASD